MVSKDCTRDQAFSYNRRIFKCIYKMNQAGIHYCVDKRGKEGHYMGNFMSGLERKVLASMFMEALPRIAWGLQREVREFPVGSYYQACAVRSGVEYFFTQDYQHTWLADADCMDCETLGEHFQEWLVDRVDWAEWERKFRQFTPNHNCFTPWHKHYIASDDWGPYPASKDHYWWGHMRPGEKVPARQSPWLRRLRSTSTRPVDPRPVWEPQEGEEKRQPQECVTANSCSNCHHISSCI